MRRHISVFVSLWLSVFVLNTSLLRAYDETKSKAQVTKTERVDFPPGGTLRLNSSIGELTIQGWDRPDVEITTIKTTKAAYPRAVEPQALGEIKDPRAIEPLIAASKDADVKVRRRAVQALGEIKDSRVVEPLIAARNDTDSNVRALAGKALAEITDNGSQEREKAIQNLNGISIKAERRGDEVVITTEYPGYPVFPPPRAWHNNVNFDIEYRISAPRNARLVVDQEAGEVHVDEMAGDIRATVLKGALTLRLPDDSYAIDAKSDVGSIFSDFPGQQRSRRLHLGTQFAGQPSPAAHKLYLRVGFGDIAITKIRKAPYALPVNPPAGPKQ